MAVLLTAAGDRELTADGFGLPTGLGQGPPVERFACEQYVWQPAQTLLLHDLADV